MAYVTRCPYCNAVWLLPNRDVADRGPVKCADCKHSFAATSYLLQVPDALFPHHQFEHPAPSQPAAAPEPLPPPQYETAPCINDINGRAEPKIGNLADVTVPAQPERRVHLTPLSLPENTAAPEKPASPAQDEVKAQDKPIQERTENAASALSASDDELVIGETISNLNLKAPAKKPESKPRSSGIGSFILMLVLLLIAGAVAAVIYNQEVIRRLPQAQAIFNQVCQKIPCPGFSLRNIQAFVITKSTLTAGSDQTHYALSLDMQNQSDFSQQLPHLEILLSNDAGRAVFKTLLAPEEYALNATQHRALKSHESLSLKINLQTDHTSALECTVRPVYPK